MNLTLEQREAGKQNFFGAIGSELTRREFLERSIAAAAVGGVGLGSFYFGYTKLTNPVRVGIIGTGDEGSVLIGAHNPEYLNIVAMCDIRPYNVHRAFHGDTASPAAKVMRPGLIDIYKWSGEDQARQQVKVYADYRELLDNPDIEGVIIATPLFLHDKIAIEAMQKGKHVLTEKLMAHSVGQCKDMGRVSKQTKKILATGHQRHYSILYDNAVDTIQQGLLGDLHHIRAQWHRGNLPGRDSWAPPLPDQLAKDLEGVLKKVADAEKKGDMKRVETLRKDMQLMELKMKDADVDAKKYGYQDHEAPDGSPVSALRELIHWRLWNRTGGGLMAELGSHQLDAAGIFCTAVRKDGKKARPLSVVGVGGRHIFPDDREVDDHVYCMFEFPGPEYDNDPKKKIVVTYSSINGNSFGDWGEIVMGTEGTLILDKEQESMIFKGGAPTSVSVAKGKGDKPVLEASPSPTGAVAVGQQALGGGKPISRGYTEEMEHWAWCIRNFDYEQNQPKCKPEVAMADAIVALTTNRAIRDKTRIEFQNDWFNIESDDVPDGPAPTVKV